MSRCLPLTAWVSTRARHVSLGNGSPAGIPILAAFEMLVARHRPMVLRVCRAVLRNPSDAKDAFQATFLILVEKVRTLRDHANLGGWLHLVAHGVAIRAIGAASS